MATYYKHDITQWREGTSELSDRAYRVYHVIIENIMLNEGPCLLHERSLAGHANRSVRDFKAALQELVAAGKIIIEGGKLYNKRAEAEIEGIISNRKNASTGGKNRAENLAKIRENSSESPRKVRENSVRTPREVVEDSSNGPREMVGVNEKPNDINEPTQAVLHNDLNYIRLEKTIVSKEVDPSGLVASDKKGLDLETVPDEKKAFDIYNRIAERVGWPKASAMTEKRKGALKARLKDAEGLQGFTEVIERGARASYLTGSNNRGWLADLDFFLTQSKFIKVKEGSFDDNRSNGHAISAGANRGSVDTILSAAARRAARFDSAGREAAAGNGFDEGRPSGFNGDGRPFIDDTSRQADESGNDGDRGFAWRLPAPDDKRR